MPGLFLHVCCGPCATTVIERLSGMYDITAFFYNPNIYPKDEYNRRLDAAREVSRRAGILLVEGDYNPDDFISAVKGFESEPENGRRCIECYRLRLEATSVRAREEGFATIGSTLTVGPMKRAGSINPVGHEAAKQASLTFLDGDWKKDGGFKRSCELSKEYGIYRQRYCGCMYSMRD